MHNFARSFLAAVLVAPPLVFAGATQQPKLLHIGLAKSFLEEQPKSFQDIATDDFKNVLKKTTGLDGEPTANLGAFEIADKLSKKQLDLGILHAHELAWVQKDHPDLEPILVAVNKK